jgi:signal transduction histidine kinase
MMVRLSSNNSLTWSPVMNVRSDAGSVPAAAQPSLASASDLQRAERLLGWFQQALGHELPNHLVAIQGLLNLLELEEGDHLSRNGREYLRRVSANTQKAQRLLRALTDIGRVRHLLALPEPIALAELAQELTTEMKPLYPDRDIEYHFCAGVPQVTAPRQALRQVLLQLLRRALQTPSGPHLRIELGSRAMNTGAEIWVSDNARGLTPQQQQQLFDPFAGSDLIGSTEKLDWILVREMVESWGGTLRVESEVDRGSCVTLSVPFPH